MVKFIHNIWWLDMFRTSVIHPQERLYKLYVASLVCGVLRTTGRIQ